MRVAVIGGGWAGLAAAIEATARGHVVTLYEMAAQLGGRARRVDVDGLALDNGQHLLIGAYTQTLGLMRRIGVDPEQALSRLPLTLVDARGRGLMLRPGRRAPLPEVARAVLLQRDWSRRDRWRLLLTAARWMAQGWRCDPRLTVSALIDPLPEAVRRDFIEPLAIAALNTPLHEASAAVLLRVLRDALSGGAGAADLLIPRVTMSDLLPTPASRWLSAAGATLRCGQRVQRIEVESGGWLVDGEGFEAAVLAASASEAARLMQPLAPQWSGLAAALRHQPIATVYLEGAAAAPWPAPMVVLRSDERAAPAQFAFDLGRLGREAGLVALVCSAAATSVERGVPALEAATLEQARRQLPGRWTLLRTLVDRRATFACTPGLLRPARAVTAGLVAAGDYIEGPYPGTLEAAVQSGIDAARALPSCK